MAEEPRATPVSYVRRLEDIERRLDQMEGMTQRALEVFGGLIQGQLGVDKAVTDALIAETMRRVKIVDK